MMLFCDRKHLTSISYVFVLVILFGRKEKLKNEFWPNGALKKEVCTRRYMQNDSIIVLRYQQQDTVPDNVSLVEEYYSNLKIKSKGSFINNLKDREWKFWYKNGQLALIENYNNGRKVGLYQSWFESGQILEIVDYGK